MCKKEGKKKRRIILYLGDIIEDGKRLVCSFIWSITPVLQVLVQIAAIKINSKLL